MSLLWQVVQDLQAPDRGRFLTAGVTLLVAAVQTVVVSVALPQGPYAALIVTLELIAFTPLRLRGAAGGFWRQGGSEGGGGEAKLTGDFL